MIGMDTGSLSIIPYWGRRVLLHHVALCWPQISPKLLPEEEDMEQFRQRCELIINILQCFRLSGQRRQKLAGCIRNSSGVLRQHRPARLLDAIVRCAHEQNAVCGGKD